MSEWKETTVGHICGVKGGKRLPAGKEFAEGVTPFPYLRVTDMVDGSIDQTSLVYVKPEIEPFIKNYKISKDNLYVTIAGTLGLFGTIPDNLDNAQLTENAAKLCEIDFSEFNKNFLKYYLNSENIQTQIRREIGVGGGVPKLALFRIEKLKVKYPEKKVQDHIALILTTCDAVIEKTQAAIAKYKAIKQGMLHDLFTRGIDIATGKLRPEYEDAPELYKESKLGMVPKEWDVERLESLCSEKPTYGINAAAVDFTHQLPTYIRITDIDEEGNFSKTGRKCVDSAFSSNYLLKPGDLVFARTGATVGKTYLYNEADGLLVFAGFLIKVSPNTKILNSDFLKFLTETPYYQNWVGLMSQRSGQPGINGNEYGSLLVPKPDLTEQNKIAAKLLTIQNKVNTEQSYLHKLQSIKQGLMADLLSGKKRVPLPEEAITQTEN